MITNIAGIVLGLLIGAACRWFDLPSPAPPRIIGALLVLLMTAGFLVTDLYLRQP